MQAFIDGAQLSGGAVGLFATALRDVFATDSYVTDRVGQVNYLWRRLNGGVPRDQTRRRSYGLWSMPKHFCRI